MNCIKSLNFKRIVAYFLLSIVLLSSCAPGLVTRAEETSFKKDFISECSIVVSTYVKSFQYRICTDGNLTCVSYFGQTDSKVGFCKYYISTSPIYYNDCSLDSNELILAPLYNGVYYCDSGDLDISKNTSDNATVTGLFNIKNVEPNSGNFFLWLNYLKADIDAGVFDLDKDNYRDLDPDQDGTLSTSIPTPRIHVSKDYSFAFDNCTDDYYIQMQGRFWSVDDIELYKENLMWKYKYSSSIKGKLNDWYSASSKRKANHKNLSFLENGQAYFDEFLAAHPVDDRNYFGGTNAVGNYFSGYSDALGTIKMLLKQPTSGYNGVEVYVRYFTFDDSGNLIYGKWCHYYDDIAKNGSSGSDWDDDDTLHDGQQSGDGLTDDDKDAVEKGDDTRTGDPDINVPTPDDDYTGTGVAFTGVIELLNNLKDQMGGFLGLFSDVFSFLPSWLLNLIYASIGVCCFLGVWHFIRG